MRLFPPSRIKGCANSISYYNVNRCKKDVKNITSTLPSPPSCEKIRLGLFPVIPAEAGVQYFQAFKNRLDPGFHRGDD